MAIKFTPTSITEKPIPQTKPNEIAQGIPASRTQYTNYNVFRKEQFSANEIRTEKGESALVYSRPLLGGNQNEKYIEILDQDQNRLNNQIYKLEFVGGAYKGTEAQIKDRLINPRIEDNPSGETRGFSVVEINGRANPAPNPAPCPKGTPPWKCQDDHYEPSSVS